MKLLGVVAIIISLVLIISPVLAQDLWFDGVQDQADIFDVLLILQDFIEGINFNFLSVENLNVSNLTVTNTNITNINVSNLSAMQLWTEDIYPLVSNDVQIHGDLDMKMNVLENISRIQLGDPFNYPCWSDTNCSGDSIIIGKEIDDGLGGSTMFGYNIRSGIGAFNMYFGRNLHDPNGLTNFLMGNTIEIEDGNTNVLVGRNIKLNGTSSSNNMIFGYDITTADTTNTFNTLVGRFNTLQGGSNTIFGYSSNANGTSNSVAGTGNNVQGDYNSIVGSSCTSGAESDYNVILGYQSAIEDEIDNSISIGRNSSSWENNCIAIGENARCNTSNSLTTSADIIITQSPMTLSPNGKPSINLTDDTRLADFFVPINASNTWGNFSIINASTYVGVNINGTDTNPNMAVIDDRLGIGTYPDNVFGYPVQIEAVAGRLFFGEESSAFTGDFDITINPIGVVLGSPSGNPVILYSGINNSIIIYNNGYAEFQKGINFASSTVPIGGIENQNLLDKTATETITGRYYFNGGINSTDWSNATITTDQITDYNSPIYGSMYENASQSITISAPNKYYNLTGFDEEVLNGVTIKDNTSLVVSESGTYLISHNVERYYTGIGSPPIYSRVTVKVFETPQPQCENDMVHNSANDKVTGSSTCILNLNANDEIRLALMNEVATTNFRIESRGLTLTRIG